MPFQYMGLGPRYVRMHARSPAVHQKHLGILHFRRLSEHLNFGEILLDTGNLRIKVVLPSKACYCNLVNCAPSQGAWSLRRGESPHALYPHHEMWSQFLAECRFTYCEFKFTEIRERIRLSFTVLPSLKCTVIFFRFGYRLRVEFGRYLQIFLSNPKHGWIR